MHIYLVVAAALAVGLLAAAGIAAVARDWVVPWGRGRIVRPRLWGYGALLGAVGTALFLFLGPLADAEPRPLPVVGQLMLMAGLLLQYLAQRPGRTSAPPPTSSAS
ncbi:hypothetical protein ACFY0F_12240 [Streptomyces sp. NPDC001544]|uniref:hypothetical protein n=1 Tax=Streptomyces sp. NPDC001544 TaxID=3364584 RepID=UPI0036C7B2D0